MTLNDFSLQITFSCVLQSYHIITLCSQSRMSAANIYEVVSIHLSLLSHICSADFFHFRFRLMEMRVLETLVKLLQGEEDEEELPEQVIIKNI